MHLSYALCFKSLNAHTGTVGISWLTSHVWKLSWNTPGKWKLSHLLRFVIHNCMYARAEADRVYNNDVLTSFSQDTFLITRQCLLSS